MPFYIEGNAKAGLNKKSLHLDKSGLFLPNTVTESFGILKLINNFISELNYHVEQGNTEQIQNYIIELLQGESILFYKYRNIQKIKFKFEQDILITTTQSQEKCQEEITLPKVIDEEKVFIKHANDSLWQSHLLDKSNRSVVLAGFHLFIEIDNPGEFRLRDWGENFPVSEYDKKSQKFIQKVKFTSKFSNNYWRNENQESIYGYQLNSISEFREELKKESEAILLHNCISQESDSLQLFHYKDEEQKKILAPLELLLNDIDRKELNDVRQDEPCESIVLFINFEAGEQQINTVVDTVNRLESCLMNLEGINLKLTYWVYFDYIKTSIINEEYADICLRYGYDKVFEEIKFPINYIKKVISIIDNPEILFGNHIEINTSSLALFIRHFNKVPLAFEKIIWTENLMRDTINELEYIPVFFPNLTWTENLLLEFSFLLRKFEFKYSPHTYTSLSSWLLHRPNLSVKVCRKYCDILPWSYLMSRNDLEEYYCNVTFFREHYYGKGINGWFLEAHISIDIYHVVSEQILNNCLFNFLLYRSFDIGIIELQRIVWDIPISIEHYTKRSSRDRHSWYNEYSYWEVLSLNVNIVWTDDLLEKYGDKIGYSSNKKRLSVRSIEKFWNIEKEELVTINVDYNNNDLIYEEVKFKDCLWDCEIIDIDFHSFKRNELNWYGHLYDESRINPSLADFFKSYFDEQFSLLDTVKV